MKKQKFIEEVEKSSLSEKRKKKIITMLNEYQVFSTTEIKKQIKAIIKEDIKEISKGFDMSEYKEYIEE